MSKAPRPSGGRRRWERGIIRGPATLALHNRIAGWALASEAGDSVAFRWANVLANEEFSDVASVSSSRQAVDHREFDRLVREWIAEDATGMSGPSGVPGVTHGVHVRRDDRIFVLHADARTEAAAAYLKLVERYGDEITWNVVPSDKGKLSAVAFGPECVRVESMYFYINPALVAAAVTDLSNVELDAVLSDRKRFLDIAIPTSVSRRLANRRCGQGALRE
jgi:hypothetical protein